MKCKPYSEITEEIRTQLKTVKITSNIFAVYSLGHIFRKFEHFNCTRYHIYQSKETMPHTGIFVKFHVFANSCHQGANPQKRKSVGYFKNDPLQLLLMTFLSGEPSLGFRIYLAIPNF